MAFSIAATPHLVDGEGLRQTRHLNVSSGLGNRRTSAIQAQGKSLLCLMSRIAGRVRLDDEGEDRKICVRASSEEKTKMPGSNVLSRRQLVASAVSIAALALVGAQFLLQFLNLPQVHVCGDGGKGRCSILRSREYDGHQVEYRKAGEDVTLRLFGHSALGLDAFAAQR